MANIKRTKLYIQNKKGTKTHLIIFRGYFRQAEADKLQKNIVFLNEQPRLPKLIGLAVPEGVTCQVIRL